MKKGRFIIIVLDSFGIGAMEDVKKVRTQDIGANTCLHLLDYPKEKNWPTLTKLGLFNALGVEKGIFIKQRNAIFGSSNLKHYGADSYFGHQEIMGTNPRKPIFTELSVYLADIEADLIEKGYIVKRHTQEKLQMLKVNNVICVCDNMETDLGQAINVIGDLDSCGFELIKNVGKIVRNNVPVARVIAFGGSNVSFERLLANVVTKKNRFIGIDAPSSGVYDENYHVVHLGFGVDTTKQLPYSLAKVNVKNYFYGKVADVVENPNGKNFSCVDTHETFDELIKDMKQLRQGFFCLNIQETDLAGHAEDANKYIEHLNISDQKIQKIIDLKNENDILIIMADHGNDPTIGHSRHTRERVPLLIHTKDSVRQFVDLGIRNTLADVGATAAEYFDVTIEFGTSFLKDIQ